MSSKTILASVLGIMLLLSASVVGTIMLQPLETMSEQDGEPVVLGIDEVTGEENEVEEGVESGELIEEPGEGVEEELKWEVPEEIWDMNLTELIQYVIEETDNVTLPDNNLSQVLDYVLGCLENYSGENLTEFVEYAIDCLENWVDAPEWLVPIVNYTIECLEDWSGGDNLTAFILYLIECGENYTPEVTPETGDGGETGENEDETSDTPSDKEDNGDNGGKEPPEEIPSNLTELIEWLKNNVTGIVISGDNKWLPVIENLTEWLMEYNGTDNPSDIINYTIECLEGWNPPSELQPLVGYMIGCLKTWVDESGDPDDLKAFIAYLYDCMEDFVPPPPDLVP